MVRFVCQLVVVLVFIAVAGCSVSSKQSRSAQNQQQLEYNKDGLNRVSVKNPDENEADTATIIADKVVSDLSQSSIVLVSDSQLSLPLLPSSEGLNTATDKKVFSQKVNKIAGPFPLFPETENAPAPSLLLLDDQGQGEERSQGDFSDESVGVIPLPSVESTSILRLQDVLDSVYESYPLLKTALLSRSIADGELLSSQGAFDLKLKGGGTSGPLGFYKTNRFGAGVSQPLFSGGEIFGGYKVGRGNFQPWFKERQTDDGGEFSVGIAIPLSQNRLIDKRRAAQFRASFGRDAVEPEIQTQIISFVWESSYSYWMWVAAGQNYQITQTLLEIAQQRNDGLKIRVERGDLSPIELTDNQRLIVSREAALIDAKRKLQQSAIKLSLFLRTPDGRPIVPTEDQLPSVFPEATSIDSARMESDIHLAMSNRPELVSLELLRRQIKVDLAQARNLYLPSVDAVFYASKDVGAASSSIRDKTPFELEASLQVNVPLQRRKAIGKIQAIEAKLAQLSVKIGFAQDKISTDVQNVYAAMLAAFNRIRRAEESLELARTMEQAERRKFDLGESNLLLVNLRELATAGAAKNVLQSQLDYFQAQADYRAAMAFNVNLESTP